MKIILALHSSAETAHSPNNLWRSYPREMELASLLRGHNIEIVGSIDKNTWCETFYDLCAKIESADIVIATDNGILALSLALKKKTVAIFGPTDEKIIVTQFEKYSSAQYRIVRSDHEDDLCKRPCNMLGARGFEVNGKCAKGRADCIEEILPEQIVSAVVSLIS